MATKIICDICDKEIKNGIAKAKIEISYPNLTRCNGLIYPDVCDTCAERVKKFIEEQKYGG